MLTLCEFIYKHLLNMENSCCSLSFEDYKFLILSLYPKFKNWILHLTIIYFIPALTGFYRIFMFCFISPNFFQCFFNSFQSFSIIFFTFQRSLIYVKIWQKRTQRICNNMTKRKDQFIIKQYASSFWFTIQKLHIKEFSEVKWNMTMNWHKLLIQF